MPPRHNHSGQLLAGAACVLALLAFSLWLARRPPAMVQVAAASRIANPKNV